MLDFIFAALDSTTSPRSNKPRDIAIALGLFILLGILYFLIKFLIS